VTNVNSFQNGNTSSIISLENVSKTFGEIEAIKNINLEIEPGKVYSILGPSGSGKSTLLRCINFLEEPDQGRVFIDGEQLGNNQKLLNRLRTKTAMVFQQFNLYPHMNIRENLTSALRIVKKMDKGQADKIAETQLAKVGILDKADAYPSQLSGGQQQRAAIARALAMEPEIMLFDEPTSALDPEMIKEVLDVMLLLANEGMTMLVVTHEMGFARAASDQIIFMDAGQVVEQGDAETFFTASHNNRVKAFLSQIISSHE
jgi:ABC-type polar amino acid transport system ATPase subunit